MNETVKSDVKIASKSAVTQAAKHFAEVLANTTQFKEFDQAYHSFRQDTEAQNDIQEFQKKQESLKALLLLNAVSDEDRQELQRLQDRFYQQPTYVRTLKAQDDLMKICQELGDQISKTIGLDYASSCRKGGCCG